MRGTPHVLRIQDHGATDATEGGELLTANSPCRLSDSFGAPSACVTTPDATIGRADCQTGETPARFGPERAGTERGL